LISALQPYADLEIKPDEKKLKRSINDKIETPPFASTFMMARDWN
jgi:hypothetical protein